VFYTEHALISTLFIQSTLKFPRALYRARSNFHVFYPEHARIYMFLTQRTQ